MQGSVATRIVAFLGVAVATSCAQLSGVNDLHSRGGSKDASVDGPPSGGAGGTGPGDSGGLASAATGGKISAAGGRGNNTAGGGGVPVRPVDSGTDSSTKDGGGCAAGQVDCNGICVPSDIHNCGACGHDCTVLAHVKGAVTCAAGACAYGAEACADGYANCSGNPDDGCNVAINLPARCGACDVACGAGTSACSPVGSSTTEFACTLGCAAPLTLCSGSCINLATDPQHCGTCSKTCPPATGGTATCSAGGICGVSCNATSHLCKGACVSNTDPNNCGTLCATNCPAPTSGGGVAACNGNLCALSCPPQTVACAGACRNLTGTDVNNCGACGRKCAAGTSCSNGSCVCPANLTDCNGACINTSASDNNNCGGCGTKCTGNKTCQGASCVCPSGTVDCHGTCANLQTDQLHCGRCDHDCFAGNCTTGKCQQWTIAEPPVTVSVRTIGSDGNSVFWGDTQTNGVYRVPVGGGAKTRMATDASFSDVDSIAVSGGTVAWVTDNKIWTAKVTGPADSGTPFSFAFPTDLGILCNLALDGTGTRAAVMLNGDYSLYDCALAGTRCNTAGAYGFYVEGAAANASNYYFPSVADQSVHVHAFGTSSTSLIPSTDGLGAQYMAIDATNVYWLAQQGVVKTPVDGLGPVTPVVPNISSLFSLAADGTNLYYLTTALYYVPITTSGTGTLLSSSGGSDVVAVAGKIIWHNDDTIWGIAPP